MSRIGKLPVAVPDKVKVAIQGNLVNIEGPKGKLARSFDRAVTIAQEDGSIVVKPADSSRHANAMYGTARSIIAGMVVGVTEGYVKNVEVKGVGFRAAVQGKKINLALGYSHPIDHDIPEGVNVSVAENTKIKIEGCDKQAVGQMAAALESYYPPEPYKGKGVHVAGKYYRRKEGKKAG